MSPFRDTRGVALITALIALMLLTTLMVAFAVLSKSEPAIATNQAQTVQARALAESGIERAIWALASSVIPSPMVGTVAPAPYDGSQYLSVGSSGGFYVTVAANGAVQNERIVDAVGWYPATSGLQTAHRHIHLTVMTITGLKPIPPASVTVEGDVDTKGSAVTISAASDTSCGAKDGIMASGFVNSTANPTIQGGGSAPATQQNVPTSTVNSYMFSNTDLDTLKALAMAAGTYFKGNQTFNSSNPWPTSGIVFVDTTSGNNMVCTAPGPSQTCTTNGSPTPSSDYITVTVSGTGQMPTLNGWLIVNGSINYTGNATVNGLVYAMNDISMAGSANVNGAVVSKNITDTSTTSVDSTFSGTPTAAFNCANAKTPGGGSRQSWFVKRGTYREESD